MNLAESNQPPALHPFDSGEAGRIYWILWIFLYLKFPPASNASQREAGGEESLNKQSATPKSGNDRGRVTF